MTDAQKDQYRRASDRVRDAKTAVADALSLVEYDPQCATSDEFILRGIVAQLAAIQRAFADEAS